MEATDRLAKAGAALRSCPPYAMVETLRARLADDFGAQGADLLLADYRLTMLQPVLTPPHVAQPCTVQSSTAGRAFIAQQPVLEPGPDGSQVVVHLPVTMRGDRLGVLAVRLPARPDDDTVAELASLGTMFAHELAAAERDTDVYLKARRRQRLTLAAEMQWELLPGRGTARPQYVLGGQLEPAYSIGGDNFDWATGPDQLTLTVTNGMGSGIQAALLTSLAVYALRNARRAGLDLAEQATLADQAVYAQYGGDCYLATLLMRFDVASGRVAVVDAGSPRLLRLRENDIEPIELDAQLPLGMFDGTHYREQEMWVEPGDRLVIASDGVHTAAPHPDEMFGDSALAAAVLDSAFLSPSAAAQAMIGALLEYHRDTDLQDDAVVVCLDWLASPAA
jgi:serine phosphatase RsbU (regulator of sigma subunit)